MICKVTLATAMASKKTPPYVQSRSLKSCSHSPRSWHRRSAIPNSTLLPTINTTTIHQHIKPARQNPGYSRSTFKLVLRLLPFRAGRAILWLCGTCTQGLVLVTSWNAQFHGIADRPNGNGMDGIMVVGVRMGRGERAEVCIRSLLTCAQRYGYRGSLGILVGSGRSHSGFGPMRQQRLENCQLFWDTKTTLGLSSIGGRLDGNAASTSLTLQRTT